ncbi:transketolase [Oxalobacteraceae bacterium CAVE-383]|nr:transketolase [Oxalobacteraceae bacterium CAVE-383]
MHSPHPFSEIDELSVNTLRFLAVDAVQKANSGHPGLPLDAAPMAYVLWTRFLKHHPANPQWFDRDRFVLSAGHGSALLYALLHMTGYDLPMAQLQQFRQWESITPGHPERNLTPGVEVTTGPLGQGFGNGVGMAIAEANLAGIYNRDGYPMVDHFTYGIVSDGDLMEGIASEAASLAGHLQLGKLIYLYDANQVTLSAGTDVTFTEDVAGRFDAYGWHTQWVEDGNDLAGIERAIAAAQAETRRPSLLLVRTHLGYGSPKQDTFEAHGSPLGEEGVRATKRKLGWPEAPPFIVPEEVRAHFLALNDGAEHNEEAWWQRFAGYEKQFPDLCREFRQRLRTGPSSLPAGWDADMPQFPADAKGVSTRVASGKIMNAVARRFPALTGGSADLDPSTFTALNGLGVFQPDGIAAPDKQESNNGDWNRAGRNISFGVREHAMGSIMNGMAAHGGMVPYGATFLMFSEYMRPAIRLAALMGLHVVYVFTHDSIALGEDGPTHQPIEQLASLRAIPKLLVIRPADANEAVSAWRVAAAAGDRPVALVLTRQNVPTLDRGEFAAADGLRRGAYILADAAGGKPALTLIASGSEVTLIVAAREQLLKQNIDARIVSMPCWELFDEQPQDYRDSVLMPGSARMAVEAGIAQGWHRYVGERGDVLSIEKFGASANAGVMMREYGYTVENVCKRAVALLAAQPK